MTDCNFREQPLPNAGLTSVFFFPDHTSIQTSFINKTEDLRAIRRSRTIRRSYDIGGFVGPLQSVKFRRPLKVQADWEFVVAWQFVKAGKFAAAGQFVVAGQFIVAGEFVETG
jgi:hypothetical protein